MGKKIKVNKQLNAGRPKTAVDKANLPEKETTPTPQMGDHPKQIIGSHMGMMMPVQPKGGPAIPRPPKPPARGKVAPKF